MLSGIKNIIRKTFFAIGIDLTQNQVYDRLTLAIMKKVLNHDSGCIDIGCHKGEVMDEMIRYAPQGIHCGFEPIPEYYEYLVKKYSGNDRIRIIPKALSNENGTTEFNWVKNAPAFSGIRERSYLVKKPDIEKITVELARLDDLLPELTPVRLIKIDVEGAEMNVLNGAVALIKRDQPYVVFEFGLGASDHYGTTADDVYTYFAGLGYGLYTLKGFVKNGAPLPASEFAALYLQKKEYYFIAAPGTP